jgi:hypothetical protein
LALRALAMMSWFLKYLRELPARERAASGRRTTVESTKV